MTVDENNITLIRHTRNYLSELMLELSRGRNMHVKEINDITTKIVDTMCMIVLENEENVFIPHFYSLAQSYANKHSILGTISVIFYDNDNCETVSELLKLIEEMKEYALELILSRPNIWFRSEHPPKEFDNTADALLSKHKHSQMITVLGCDDYDDADWREVIIEEPSVDVDDDDEEAVKCAYSRFYSIELAKASIQYLNILLEDGFDSATALYETTCSTNFIVSNNPKRRLDDADYERRSALFNETARQIIMICNEELEKGENTTPDALMESISRCCQLVHKAVKSDEALDSASST